MDVELDSTAASALARRIFGENFFCAAAPKRRRVCVRREHGHEILGEGRTWQEAFAAARRTVGLVR